MVQSIRYWLLATRMADERITAQGREIQPTALGSRIFGSPETDGWDPFLEDDNTLWLLHWRLAGPGSQSFTWAWTFNLLREYEFSRDTLVDSVLGAAISRVARPPARETIARDVECMLHTYVGPSGSTANEDGLDCPLTFLGLIRPSFDRYFRFDIGPKATLNSTMFCFALCEFWRWWSPASTAITVRDITYETGSPGIVFKLDEDSVLEYLDEIAGITDGILKFEDSPLVRQVVRRREATLPSADLLERHYSD
jgi:hypothetical protein